MATGLRKSGISFMGDMPWGAHFCSFYETKQDLLDTLVPYFAAGLANQEFCLWVLAEDVTEEEARAALRQIVPDLDRYLADRSIEIVSIREWYLQDGAFARRRVLRRLLEKLDQALAGDYAGMRVAESTAWLQKQDRQLLHNYEMELGASIATECMIVLCSFPLAGGEAVDTLDAARIHQLAVGRRHGAWEMVEPPELQQAWTKIKRLNEETEQRVVERVRELAAVNEALTREIALLHFDAGADLKNAIGR
jgi:hypothetical protein